MKLSRRELLAVGAGQMSRVDSVKIGIRKVLNRMKAEGKKV